MKPIVIGEIGNQLCGLSTDDAMNVIDEYFSRIIWSLEKDEWERMSRTEKHSLLKKIIKWSEASELAPLLPRTVKDD